MLERSLKNPPISEAIIEIKFKYIDDLEQLCSDEFQKTLRDEFPNQQKQWNLKFTAKATDQKSVDTEVLYDKFAGYILKSEDGKNIAQLMADRFTFSKLKPYEKWDSFYKVAMELWHKFAALVKPDKISGLGLRYINKIPLEDNEKASDYFRNPLQAPEGVAGKPKAHLSRYSLLDDETKINTNVIQTWSPSNETAGTRGSLILDIDVLVRDDITIDKKIIDSFFNDLRSFKNKIFMESITAGALEKWS